MAGLVTGGWIGVTGLSAQDARPQPPAGEALADAPPPPPPGHGGHPILRLLDEDGDGLLSAAEVDRAPAVLMSFDRNSDGMLDEAELREALPPPPRMGDRRGERGGPERREDGGPGQRPPGPRGGMGHK